MSQFEFNRDYLYRNLNARADDLLERDPGCFRMEPRGIEQRHRAMLGSNQQHDLRAARNQGAGVAFDQAGNHHPKGVT
jgi:hypothetical protein